MRLCALALLSLARSGESQQLGASPRKQLQRDVAPQLPWGKHAGLYNPGARPLGELNDKRGHGSSSARSDGEPRRPDQERKGGGGELRGGDARADQSAGVGRGGLAESDGALSNHPLSLIRSLTCEQHPGCEAIADQETCEWVDY